MAIDVNYKINRFQQFWNWLTKKKPTITVYGSPNQPPINTTFGSPSNYQNISDRSDETILLNLINRGQIVEVIDGEFYVIIDPKTEYERTIYVNRQFIGQFVIWLAKESTFTKEWDVESHSLWVALHHMGMEV